MFGMQGNPFIPTFTKEETELKEDTIMSKKYLETRPGSLEAAVHRAVDSETPQINPDTGRAILTLPKNKYLNTKEGSLENAVEQVLVEKHDPSDYDPATHTQVGSRQKIKPSFNTKTHRLIVKDGTVKVIAKAIWRARGKVLRQQGWSLAEALDDVNPKALKGKHKDRKDADIDNDGDMDIVSASQGDDTIAWYENNAGIPEFSNIMMPIVSVLAIVGFNYRRRRVSPDE